MGQPWGLEGDASKSYASNRDYVLFLSVFSWVTNTTKLHVLGLQSALFNRTPLPTHPQKSAFVVVKICSKFLGGIQVFSVKDSLSFA